VNIGNDKVKNLLAVGSGVEVVPEDDSVTIFAPKSSSFTGVALTQDTAKLKRVSIR
jgi:uncharacterized surface protein with fasciclin (FAS1) repeats